jgi:hypothetical protein
MPKYVRKYLRPFMPEPTAAEREINFVRTVAKAPTGIKENRLLDEGFSWIAMSLPSIFWGKITVLSRYSGWSWSRHRLASQHGLFSNHHFDSKADRVRSIATTFTVGISGSNSNISHYFWYSEGGYHVRTVLAL